MASPDSSATRIYDSAAEQWVDARAGSGGIPLY
jgi:hypothetical protein